MLQVIRYNEKYFDKWNKFVEDSNNGTIFHRIDFLDYHKDRFVSNEHHLIWIKGESIFAVMPFAIFDQEKQRVGKTPYGSSFGGIVVSKKFRLKHAVETYKSLSKYFYSLKLDRIEMTLIPSFYSSVINFNFEYILSKEGYNISSRDVFNVVKLSGTYEDIWDGFDGRARTSIRKSKKKFDIFLDVKPEDFYPILIEDKHRHNNSKPTHTLEDLIYLKQKFPKRIFFDIAVLKNNGAKAGVCYFICNTNVIMTFYMAQETLALKEDGINVLLEYGFKRGKELNMKYLDFGGSTVGYEIQNIGVANFKESFGATSYLREKYCK